MIERESIRLRRLAGLPREQWTQDPIMASYSFTNVKRHHDRVTMGLIESFYREDRQRHDATRWEDSLELCRVSLLNCVLARFFGLVSTMRAIGWSDGWSSQRADQIIAITSLIQARGEKVFTGSYIVPSGGSSAPKYETVCTVAGLVWGHAAHVLDTNRWEDMSARLCQCWGVGPFMSKEILLDYILCTGWVPADWSTWTPVGPGGKRGAMRIRDGHKEGAMGKDEALDVIREIYSMRDQFWPRDFVTLDLTDIQFQLCEFDKRSRVGEGRRPKRNFNPTIDEVTCRV